jgi:hypothetical protein
MSHHYDEINRAWETVDTGETGDWKSIPRFERTIRTFDSGATRSPMKDKLEYEGFLSPLVIRRFAEYMHKHRKQEDGKLRDADNWQKGMPLDSYIDSGWRHFMDWWLSHRGYNQSTHSSSRVEEALCALMFNVMGYLHELLKEKHEIRSTEEERRRGESEEGYLLDRFAAKSDDPPYRVGFEAKD